MKVSVVIPAKTLNNELLRPLEALWRQKGVEIDISVMGGDMNYAQAMNRALREAWNPFLFVIHVDTTLLDEFYIFKLMDRMLSDDRIAIATGEVSGLEHEGEIVFSEQRADLLRVSALREVGGFINSYATDQVVCRKLRQRGYKIDRVRTFYKYIAPTSLRGISTYHYKCGYGNGYMGMDATGLVNAEYRKRMLGRILMLLFPPYLMGVLHGLARRLAR
jgi:hypothetical protein